MKKKLSYSLILLCSLGLTSQAIAQDSRQGEGNAKSDFGERNRDTTDTPKMYERQDQQFTAMALSGSQFEIRSSKLALQRSQNPQIKEYAQHMMDEHPKLNAQLRHGAMIGGQSEALMLSSEHQAVMAGLEALNGTDFDQAYVLAQIAAHQEAIGLFEKEAQYGQNPSLKVIANENLSNLRNHLEMAEQLPR